MAMVYKKMSCIISAGQYIYMHIVRIHFVC